MSKEVRSVHLFDCRSCHVQTEVINHPGLSQQYKITDKIPDIRERKIDWSAFNCPNCGSSETKVSATLQVEE
jgi:Zn finger protein HypA/HybF involved in hydrogenase expression